MTTTTVSRYDLRRDGMPLCAGCEDVFVLPEQQFCDYCARLNKELETKRQWDEEQVRLYGQLQDRVDMGVVPHAPGPPSRQLVTMGEFISVVAVGIAVSITMGYVGFWSLRWVIGFCLRHS